MQQHQAPLRLTGADYQRTHYFLTVPEGVSLEEVMTPSFWVHTKKQLRLYDLFEVVAADGSFDALIRVTSVNQVTGDIRWRVLQNWAATAAPPAVKAKEVKAADPLARFAVKHQGYGRWGVQEKATGEFIAAGISKDEATETAERAERGELQPA